MNTLTRILFTALILGLTWAVRGHFGHEWGAAWAGGTGAMAVLVASGRVDWLRRLPSLAALGALGWGAGGMMSYGIVIGYCRADTFLNSLYGYAMLAVIGGLYGFIGGGFLGLGLETSADKKPDWFVLLSGMIAGACLLWGLIIYQLEWFMTPPRSEAWALCAGAAIALAWYTYREGFPLARRVAAFSGLGAGFGFAGGNFLQIMGDLNGVVYNWWNVMEFTLGFCGGLGMAYAIAITRWPEAAKPSRLANWIALGFLTLLLPWINYVEVFESENLMSLAEELGIEDAAQFVSFQQLLGLTILVVVALGAAMTWKWHIELSDRALLQMGAFLLFAYTLYYVVFGFLIKGFFYRSLSIGDSDVLYLPILFVAAALWFFSTTGSLKTEPIQASKSHRPAFLGLVTIAVAMIVLIACVTISLHDGKIAYHERFPTQSAPVD